MRKHKTKRRNKQSQMFTQPNFMQILFTIIILRATRPQQPSELKAFRTLISASILLVIILALLTSGHADLIVKVLEHWHVLP